MPRKPAPARVRNTNLIRIGRRQFALPDKWLATGTIRCPGCNSRNIEPAVDGAMVSVKCGACRVIHRYPTDQIEVG